MNRSSVPVGGGLSHLVEAASALSKLSEGAPKSKAEMDVPVRSVISDDDERPKKSKAKKTTSGASVSKEIFPQRLHAILSDPSLSEIISWLPHGQSFVIIRPDAFAEEVLPKYLPSDKSSSTKYPSFTRKLNRWGFRQNSRGLDTGAFQHPLFKRDEPELCVDMVCQKSRKPSSAAKKKKENKSDSSSSKAQLPIKKRKMSPTTTQNATTLRQFQQQKFDGASVVSADDSRCASPAPSTSSMTTASSTSVMPPPSFTMTSLAPQLLSTNLALVQPPSALLSSWVPTEPGMVAQALKKREEMERLAAAKYMLFNAYTSALLNGNQQS